MMGMWVFAIQCFSILFLLKNVLDEKLGKG